VFGAEQFAAMKRTASIQGGKCKPKPPSKPVVPNKERAAQKRARRPKSINLSKNRGRYERDIEEKKEVPNAEIRVYQTKAKQLKAAGQSECAIASTNAECRFFQGRQNQHFVSAFSDKIVPSLKSDENDLLLQNGSLMANNRTKHDSSISRMREGFERISDAKVTEAEQREKVLFLCGQGRFRKTIRCSVSRIPDAAARSGAYHKVFQCLKP
jgi:hypothetical protein